MKKIFLTLISFASLNAFAGQDNFNELKIRVRNENTSKIIYEESLSQLSDGSGSSMFGGQPLVKNEKFGLLKTGWSKSDQEVSINIALTKAYTEYLVHPKTGELISSPVYDFDELNSLV